MRRLFVLAAALVLCAFETSGQQPVLDLTVLPTTTSSNGRAGGFSLTAELPLTVAIVYPSDQTYTVGEPFQYELEIANNSTAGVSIPWSNDSAWQENVTDSEAFDASISLALGDGIGKSLFLTGAVMYGRLDVAASIHSLTPGTSVRIRATGVWSLPGVKMRDYLDPTDGRVSITAVYRIRNGKVLASTIPSPPRSLTLEMPLLLW